MEEEWGGSSTFLVACEHFDLHAEGPGIPSASGGKSCYGYVDDSLVGLKMEATSFDLDPLWS